MADCTKCPTQREIERVLASCGACTGAVPCAPPATRDTPSPVAVPLADFVGDGQGHVGELLAAFARLGRRYDDAGLICSMLAGKTLAEIASARGVTIQAVHARWKRITEENPFWKAVACGLIGRGVGRKPGGVKAHGA